MDGAVLYDMAENRYLMSCEMDAGLAAEVRDALDREGVRYFTNILIDNTLMIYYRDLYNEAQQDVYEKLHRSPYRNFVKRPVPEGEKVIYFMILEKDSRTAEIYGKLREQPWSGFVQDTDVRFPRLSRLCVYEDIQQGGYAGAYAPESDGAARPRKNRNFWQHRGKIGYLHRKCG